MTKVEDVILDKEEIFSAASISGALSMEQIVSVSIGSLTKKGIIKNIYTDPHGKFSSYLVDFGDKSTKLWVNSRNIINNE